MPTGRDRVYLTEAMERDSDPIAVGRQTASDGNVYGRGARAAAKIVDRAYTNESLAIEAAQVAKIDSAGTTNADNSELKNIN
ncbi:MAG: hypothetical protein AAB624_03235 [Patescibacteria group bacterium]